MKLKTVSFVMLFFVALQFSFAQERTVTGTVKDQSGIELPGVAVVIKGEQKGTQTDFDGTYSLKVATGKTLVFSYIGMKTKEVKVGTSSAINVVLEEDAQQLEDVVVIAYGTAKKQSLVGAQSTVSSKQLEMRPITNLTSALSGIAPGLQATLSGGQPGTSSTIRIRGFGSINAGNDPIYVVDGSIYNGNISSIAAQDIESISVLKDAASTSLYGSSAGNGVILITTKSGNKSKKGDPVVTYNNNIGFSKRGQENYETVNAMQFYPLRWQQWYNDYKYNRNYTDDQAAAEANKDVIEALRYQPYAGIQSVYAYDSAARTWSFTNNPAAGRETFPAVVLANGNLNPEVTGLLWADDLDWEKKLFRTGIRNEHTISVSQNTDKVKTYLSLGYIKEDGYRINTSFERLSGRGNISYDVNKWFSLGTNTAYSKAGRRQPRTTGANLSNTFSFIRTIAPIYPIHQHNADGSYVLDDKGNRLYDYSRARPFRANYNPVYESELDLYAQDEDALTTRTFAEFRFLPELKLRLNYSYDILRYNYKQRFNNILGAQPEGLLIMHNRKIATTTFNQLLDYSKTFGKHSITGLLGHESYEYKNAYSEFDKKGASFMGIDEMPNYSTSGSMDSATNIYRKEGYFGRLTYGFDNKYDFSLSYRRDGSSRFATDYRWGNFWSIGAGWHLKNEAFLENVEWINLLKIRASYGTTGNDSTLNSDGGTTYYPYQTSYSFSNNYTQGGLRIANYGNPYLVWEKQVSYDAALEFGFFNRFRGSVEFFTKESDDLIFAFPLPTSTGIASVDRNIGKVRNYGVELDFTVDIMNTPDFKWSVTANGTILRNRILTLPEHIRANGLQHGTRYRYLEGRSVYEYYIQKWAGVNPDTGLAMYVLDAERYPDQADPNSANFRGVEKTGEYANYTYDYNLAKRDYAGTSIPDLQGGFATNIQWKGFDLGVQFAYQLGGYAYDNAYRGLMGRDLAGSSGGYTAHVDMLNAWKNPGDITDVPRLDAGTSGQFDSSDSDRFLISRNSLMLKNVSLGYTIPNDVVTKLGLSSLRVGLSGENLFLWAKRKGLNPMANFSGTSSSIDYNYARIVTCSLSLSF